MSDLSQVTDQIIQLYYLSYLSQHQLPVIEKMIAILWGIHVVNFLLGYGLNILGIYPRNIFGLVGIIFAPLLHGSFGHLFANTVPFFILANLLLLYGISNFYAVSLIIIVISGLATWLMGRKAVHIGASSLIMGYWAYLLVHAYQAPGILSIILGFICVYYLGGMIGNVFPTQMRTSWEGHLFGLLAGGLAAWYNYSNESWLNILISVFVIH